MLRNVKSAEENFFHQNISKEKSEVFTSQPSRDFFYNCLHPKYKKTHQKFKNNVLIFVIGFGVLG